MTCRPGRKEKRNAKENHRGQRGPEKRLEHGYPDHGGGAGRCICRDGLTPVLDAIRGSDGLIIGSPNYLSEMTASFRALYERLIFQNLTYNMETPCCNPRPVPVLLIMTSNAPDTGYLSLLRGYQQTLNRFVGPTQVLVSGNTLQLRDYSWTDWPWTMFDPEEKRKRHETVFPQECKKAFERGAALGRSD